MKLGDFRKLTANLSDDTDIVLEYYDAEDEGSVAMPSGKISVKSNKDIWLGQRFSETVVYIEDSKDKLAKQFFDALEKRNSRNKQ